MKTISMKDKYWWTPSGESSFECPRSYGIINDKGEALSRDGIAPCVWPHKKLVEAEIMPYCEGFKNHTWIQIYYWSVA